MFHNFFYYDDNSSTKKRQVDFSQPMKIKDLLNQCLSRKFIIKSFYIFHNNQLSPTNLWHNVYRNSLISFPCSYTDTQTRSHTHNLCKMTTEWKIDSKIAAQPMIVLESSQSSSVHESKKFQKCRGSFLGNDQRKKIRWLPLCRKYIFEFYNFHM